MIAIGSDHGGFDLKEVVTAHLKEQGIPYKDFGCYDKKSCDYPVYGEKVGRAVAGGEADLGILICGTGVGISLAANKVKGIRCGVCSDTTTAHLIREHNHANIIAFGARIVGAEKAKDIVKAYLEAEPMGGRHQARVQMISKIEEQ